jgi:hypothetical protein
MLEDLEALFNNLSFPKELEGQHRVLYSKILVDGTILLLTTDGVTLIKLDDDTDSVNGELIGDHDVHDVEIQVRIVKENKLIGENEFTFRINKNTLALSDDSTKMVYSDNKKTELDYNLTEIQRVFTLCERIQTLQYYVDDLDIYWY